MNQSMNQSMSQSINSKFNLGGATVGYYPVDLIRRNMTILYVKTFGAIAVCICVLATLRFTLAEKASPLNGIERKSQFFISFFIVLKVVRYHPRRFVFT